MKIDRLLGIVMYLTNRDIVSSSVLAEKFEVSTRTIQRDIEALSLAGIPIISTLGTGGGYGIMDGFKLDKQIMSVEDYLFVLTALKGFCSAYENKKLEAVQEKLMAISPKAQGMNQNIHLDFSALREGINNYISMLDNAIKHQRAVEFDYTNAEGKKTHRIIEPAAIQYKWYSWYMLGFCTEKQSYRLFRLTRIRSLEETNISFTKQHESAEKILSEYEKNDNRKYMRVKMLCNPDIRVSLEEYFPNACLKEKENGDLLLEFTAPENEQGWFGILLSFGSKIEILEPEELRIRFINHAKEIVNMYK